MSDTSILIRTKFAEFEKAFTAGIEGIVKASEVYVSALDADPRNADLFKKHFEKLVPSASWSNFEAIGRKWIHPRLVLGSVGGGGKHTMIKRLPYSVQERIFDGERFEMLTADGDTLKVDITEVTPEQCEQMLDKGGIRGMAAQKSWLDAQKVKAKEAGEAVEVMPYVVCGGKVRFRRGVELSRAELKRLLSEM